MKNYAIKLGLFGARVIKGNKTFAVFIVSNGFIILGLSALCGIQISTLYATAVIMFMWYSLFISKRYGK